MFMLKYLCYYLLLKLKGIRLNLGKKLEEVRVALNLNKKEFAQELNITQNSYTNYINGSRKVPIDVAHELNNKFNISMDWFISNEGNMHIEEFSSLVNNLNESQKNILLYSLKRAYENNELIDFLEGIEEFYIFSHLKQKFKNITSEYSFWKKFFSGTRDKNSFILILAKVLKSLNNEILKDKELTIPNAKEVLITVIKQYNLKNIEDRIKHFLTEQEKENLTFWIKNNLSDLDAYIILDNIPEILNVLREEINTYNKKAF